MPAGRGAVEVNRQPLADHVGVDAVLMATPETVALRLPAFLRDLGLEGFWIGASLAHGNPGDKGDRVR